MATTCKNCNQDFEGNFCPNCGQSAHTHEINLHFLWHDIQHGLFHFDNGLFYTLKELFTSPGYTIKEFIEGKRVKHFKPLSFLIILSTIYGLLMHYFELDETVNFTVKNKNDELYIFKQVIDWLSVHYAFTNLLLLPFLALSTFLAFKKEPYNYVQHLVLNAFLSGLGIVFRILCFPFFFFFDKKVDLQILNYIDFLAIGFKVWALYQFFDYLAKRTRFWKITLSYVYLGIIFLTVVVILGLLIALYITKLR